MEEVLVIPSELYFECGDDGSALFAAVLERSRFMPRDVAETDPAWKQIIPYCFVSAGAEGGGPWLVMRRLAAQSETRLHGKLSLGIGGHINPVDRGTGENLILAGLRRELAEEVHLEAAGEPLFRGVISDESTPVGRVHLGFVYEISCASAVFEVREPDKIAAEWADRNSIATRYGAFESWSQVVFDRYIRLEQRELRRPWSA
jgi:predicted NUDIX family phosphoesterase